MLSTVLLDKIISVDTEKQQITVQAGARVQQVLMRVLSCDSTNTPFALNVIAASHKQYVWQ